MKSTRVSMAAIAVLFLTSCAPKTYFQVYKVTPSNTPIREDSLMVYSDENCKVFYNLWSEGGNMGFRFFNKTDKNIYINLEETFFVMDNLAHNYFKNRTYTNTLMTGKAKTQNVEDAKTSEIVSSRVNSVSFSEEKVICIPSLASKIVFEYHVKGSLFHDCGLLLYPDRKQVSRKSFEKKESPFVFSNRITYSVGTSGSPTVINNEFYVSEISNVPSKLMFEKKPESFCGQKKDIPILCLKRGLPTDFYLIYKKDQEFWKH